MMEPTDGQRLLVVNKAPPGSVSLGRQLRGVEEVEKLRQSFTGSTLYPGCSPAVKRDLRGS